jgi:hypothetical protein
MAGILGRAVPEAIPTREKTNEIDAILLRIYQLERQNAGPAAKANRPMPGSKSRFQAQPISQAAKKLDLSLQED